MFIKLKISQHQKCYTNILVSFCSSYKPWNDQNEKSRVALEFPSLGQNHAGFAQSISPIIENCCCYLQFSIFFPLVRYWFSWQHSLPLLIRKYRILMWSIWFIKRADMKGLKAALDLRAKVFALQINLVRPQNVVSLLSFTCRYQYEIECQKLIFLLWP